MFVSLAFERAQHKVWSLVEAQTLWFGGGLEGRRL